MSFRGIIGDVTVIERGDAVFSIEWRIPNFLSLSLGSCDGYNSPVFHSSGARWVFLINPNGWYQNPPSGPSVWVHLYLFLQGDDSPSLPGDDSPLNVNLTVGIKGEQRMEKKRERLQKFSTNDRACFWHRLCLRSELSEQKSRLMPGNVLTISLDMKIDVLSVPRGLEELQSSFRTLLEIEEDCDVVIKVRGKEFRAHRAILRARSPVFMAMFSHDTVEKQRGVVTMEDCDPETFPDFLKHVYTGSIEIISIENVFGLYEASEKYDLKSLRKACSEFIKKNLTATSFCDAITLAVKYDDKELTEVATEFYCNNTLDIVQTAEWQVFLAENPTVGNELYIIQLRK